MGTPFFMLKIIDRYIGRQVVFSTLFAVMVLTVVLVLGTWCSSSTT